MTIRALESLYMFTFFEPIKTACTNFIFSSHIPYSFAMSVLFPPFGFLALFYSFKVCFYMINYNDKNILSKSSIKSIVKKSIQLSMTGKKALAADRADLACVLNMVGLRKRSKTTDD